MIQRKKGLHPITGNEQADIIATQIIYETLQKLSDLKTAWPVIADLSAIRTKQLDDSKLTSKLSRQFQNPFSSAVPAKIQGSIGEAIRQRVHREMENYHFFIKHAQTLQIPAEVLTEIQTKNEAYKTIELYSHKYD